MEDILIGKTLLIVEDEPDLREPLVMEFESLGCRVFEAKNGKEAFELIKTQKIDAVISDIRMPGGDGVELLKRVKDFNFRFPVVMLITGFSDLSREEAFHLGAEEILAKPFDLDEIGDAVRRLLTPAEVRWKKPETEEARKKRIELEAAALQTEICKENVTLGRGGAFFQIDKGLPRIGERLSFHVQFHSGELLVLDGSGIVRWTRTSPVEDLPIGCGVEFEYLSEPAKETVIKLADTLRLKPYIPKA